MEFFLFKKFIGAYLMPVPLSILLLLVALFGFATQRRKLGFVSGSLALALLVLLSTGPIPDSLLRPIEQKYQQFDLSQPVSHIVILGCGHTNDGRLPITAQLHSCTMYRILEAMRIYQLNPNAKLITSGATSREPFSNAEMNKRMLMALGVEEANIISFDQPKDTEEEAEVLAPHLQHTNFVVVTSASHMARALRLFEQQGLHPLAAPSEHLVKRSDYSSFLSWAPSSKHLMKAERWWYETLGQSWLTLKSWFA